MKVKYSTTGNFNKAMEHLRAAESALQSLQVQFGVGSESEIAVVLARQKLGNLEAAMFDRLPARKR